MSWSSQAASMHGTCANASSMRVPTCSCCLRRRRSSLTSPRRCVVARLSPTSLGSHFATRRDAKSSTVWDPSRDGFRRAGVSRVGPAAAREIPGFVASPRRSVSAEDSGLPTPRCRPRAGVRSSVLIATSRKRPTITVAGQRRQLPCPSRFTVSSRSSDAQGSGAHYIYFEE